MREIRDDSWVFILLQRRGCLTLLVWYGGQADQSEDTSSSIEISQHIEDLSFIYLNHGTSESLRGL